MRGGKREGAGRKPGAVSKAKRELAEMAQEHAHQAMKTLAAIHADEYGPAAARVAAAVAILDRAYGKPPQTIRGDEENPLGVRILSANPISAEEWEAQYSDGAEGMGAPAGTAKSPR